MGPSLKIFVTIFCTSWRSSIGAAVPDAVNQSPATLAAATFGGAGAIFLAAAIALTRGRLHQRGTLSR